MQYQGYIKDHRKELSSDIWQMPPLYHRLWQWLKYIVNHTDQEIPMHDGTRMLIKRGQHLTSIRGIAQGIGWYEGRKRKEPNPKTVMSALNWLEKNGMIILERGKGNRQYTLVTLVKYEDYQSFESQGNGKVTADGTAREQSMDINNNDNNELINDKEYIALIFKHWTSKNLVKHRTITPQINLQISWKLRHYSGQELMACITAYDEILNNPDYKLDTRWSLNDFLEKGHFEKFLPERKPYSFYPKFDRLPAAPPKESKQQRNKDLLQRKMKEASNGRGTNAAAPVGDLDGLPFG